MTRITVALIEMLVCGGWFLVAPGDAPAQSDEGLWQRFQYSGTYRYTTERELGEDECDLWQADWETQGALYLRSEPGRGLSMREEALGCVVSALGYGEERYTASDVACGWSGGVDGRFLGIVERTFSSLEIDTSEGVFAVEGRYVREVADGRKFVSCFHVEAELDGG